MKKIAVNKYIKSLATLSFGTLVAQFIVILASPVVTRVYSAEELGAYTIILTIVSMCAPILNARYDVIIVSANSDDEAKEIAATSIIVGLLMTVIIGLGLMFFAMFSSGQFNAMGLLVYIAVPILFIQVFINVFNNYNNRLGHYKVLASVSVVRSISQVAMQITLGFFRTGTLGLLLSQLTSLLFGFRRQLKHTPGLFFIFKNITKDRIMHTLKKYKKQPFYSAPAVFMNSLSYSLITLLISDLYDLNEVGYYSISFRILGLPISLISANVAQIYFAQASEEKRNTGNFYNTFKKTTFLLLCLSIPIFILLMLFSERAFEVIFGSGWSRAGIFVVILSPMFATRFISSSLSLSVIIGNKQKIELLLQIFFLLETFSAYFFALHLGLKIEYFLGIISFLFTITYIVWFFNMLKISKCDSR